MTAELKQQILKFIMGCISKDELISAISFNQRSRQDYVREIIAEIISLKEAEGVYYGLTLLWVLEENDELIDLLHQLMMEPWHSSYEDIVHDLQRRRNPVSVAFLKEAIQKKYPRLESYGTGTRQLISQCGYALRSIGTAESINAIYELSLSLDPVIKDEMLYHISKIEGHDDYERDYDL